MEHNYLSHPKFIASYKEKDNCESDFTFIASEKYLRDLMVAVCNDLRHPVILIDINYLDSEKRLHRIESDTSKFYFRTSCRILRHCGSKDFCYQCDKFHANFFKGISKDEIHSKLKSIIYEKIKTPPDFFVESYKSYKPEINSQYGRIFMSYYCPILGYREILYPIFFNGKAIGALTTGQILIEDDAGCVEKASEIKKEFFSDIKNQQMFDSFVKQYNVKIENPDKQIDSNYIIEKIIESDNNKIEKIFRFSIENNQPEIPSKTMNKADYDVLTKNVIEQISIIENKLIEEFENKKRVYFKKQLESILDDFLKTIKTTGENDDMMEKIMPINREQLNKLWANLYNVIHKIKDVFGFCGAWIFGEGSNISIQHQTHKRMIKKDGSADKKGIHYSYDYIEINNTYSFSHSISIDNPSLFEGLVEFNNSEIDKYNTVLIVYPNMALAFKVKELSFNKDIYRILFNEISTQFSRAYYAVELFLTKFLKEHHELTLKIYQHDSSHITERIRENNRKYFSNKNAFRQLTEEKCKDVYEDMKSVIKLVSNMTKNVDILVGSLSKEDTEIKVQDISIFKELLYKWEKMFSAKLKQRNLDIDVPSVSRFSEERPHKIRTNKELLDLMIYNLIDNAVKYAYRGTIIFLDCKQSNEPRKEEYILTVTTIGPKIEEGDIPYELYYRGKNKKGKLEGDGIGLYVVKKISDILNFPVSHSCKVVSEKYNLPLVPWYIHTDFIEFTKDKELLKDLKETHREFEGFFKFLDCEKKNQISFENDLSEEYLVKRINEPTYVVSFSLTIPWASER